jgi:hypothetical protein
MLSGWTQSGQWLLIGKRVVAFEAESGLGAIVGMASGTGFSHIALRSLLTVKLV